MLLFSTLKDFIITYIDVKIKIKYTKIIKIFLKKGIGKIKSIHPITKFLA